MFVSTVIRVSVACIEHREVHSGYWFIVFILCKGMSGMSAPTPSPELRCESERILKPQLRGRMKLRRLETGSVFNADFIQVQHAPEETRVSDNNHYINKWTIPGSRVHYTHWLV